MSEKLEIKLGHFEHPSIFYFFFLRDKPLKRHVRQIGLAISQQHTSTKNSSSQFVPSVNSVNSWKIKIHLKLQAGFLLQIVGYFHMKWLAWIRVKIVSKEANGTLRLFLMDYGYYMFAGSRDSEFTEIPENLKGESVLIKQGSLGRYCEHFYCSYFNQIIHFRLETVWRSSGSKDCEANHDSSSLLGFKSNWVR